jgi:integrase
MVLARLMQDGKLPGSLTKVPTLADFSGRFFSWLESLPADRTPKGPTRKYYRMGWKMLQRTTIAGRRIDQITSDHASVISGSSPANTNNALRTLRRMLKKAHEWGAIPSVPAIKMVEEQGREAILEPWMEQKILQLGFQPLSDVLLIMLDTGMRPAEVFHMGWEHVHWDRDVIFVPRSKSRKSKRFVGITSRVRASLLERRNDNARTSSVLLGSVSRNRNSTSLLADEGLEGWVFPSRRARSGHIETVQKQFNQAKRLAGLPKSVVLYCARHRFSTDAMECGNSFAVADAMGHSKIETTRIYQHPGTKQVRDVIEKRNQVIQ